MSSNDIQFFPQIKKYNIDEITINNQRDISKIKEEFNYTINDLKTIICRKLDDKLLSEINTYFININNIFNDLIYTLNAIIISKRDNEISQRRDEQKIRVLYSKYFHLKLVNEVLENKILSFNRKEKEFEMLKQKTGAIIYNGKVICNERKDNEIIILRTENSLLKTTIKNNEDLIMEKNDIINNLNNDILLYKAKIDELSKIKSGEYSSFSNINININESKNNYNKKRIRSNLNKPFLNGIQLISSTKKNTMNSINTINTMNSANNTNNKSSNNSKNKNKNNSNNIYSSYTINSKIMNKPKKNLKKIIKKEDYLQNTNNSKNDNTIDSYNKNSYSIKYISVNKSLFSPNNNLNTKVQNDNFIKKSRQINRIKKNKNINNSISSNLPSQDFIYSTLSIETQKKKDFKIKRNIIKGYHNNNRYAKIKRHRKANSIQYPDSTLKKMNIPQGRRDKSNSNEKYNNDSHNNSYNLFSVLKKISEIKNKSLRKNSPFSSSKASTISENFKKINLPTSQRNSNSISTMMAYKEKKNNNKGRNEYNNIINFKNVENSNIESFNDKTIINKTLINKSNNENYSVNDKNSFNIYYNNSNDMQI